MVNFIAFREGTFVNIDERQNIINFFPAQEDSLQNFDFILSCASLSPFKIAFLNAAQEHQITIGSRTFQNLYRPRIERSLEHLLRDEGIPYLTAINPVVDGQVITEESDFPEHPSSLKFADIEIGNISVQIVTESGGVTSFEEMQTNYIFYLSDNQIKIVLDKNFDYNPSSGDSIAKEIVDSFRPYDITDGLAFYWQSIIRTLLAKLFDEQFDSDQYRFKIELESTVSTLARDKYGQGRTGLVAFQNGKVSVQFQSNSD